jgi:hypothetical protein
MLWRLMECWMCTSWNLGFPRRLQAHDFVAIVTMDALGNSLHANVEAETAGHLAELLNV